MTETKSRLILDYLLAQTTQIENTYRRQWQAGDLIFWDNRSVMHCALEDYDMLDDAKVRDTHRTTLAGRRLSKCAL